MHTRFANGAHYGAYAPLGYIKDPDKKGHLLIDPETRWIVEKIFDLAVHGRGAASITRILVEEKVPTPGWLNYERYGTFANIYAGAPAEKAYAWTIAQVKSILKEETYIGHSVHNKQSNISFKNKKKVRKPQEEWYLSLIHISYNELCRKCQHECKQSFRAVVVDCPKYLSKRSKKKGKTAGNGKIP